MKVSLVMRPGSNLVRGGTEVMVDKTAEHLRLQGVEADHLTPLSRTLGDVVHFFGCFDAHWQVAEIALQKGIPIVWSPIFSTHRTAAAETARGMRKRITRSFPRHVRKLEESAARIVTLTEKEENLVAGFFGIERSRFRRVPHGVEPRFATATPALFRQRYGIEGEFVLHVGMFSRGKNQLSLIQALKGTGIRLVCIGAPFDHAYREECRRLESDFTRLLDAVEHEDPALASAYAAATTFCLPSHNEVFPLTALEAAVAGCSLVLGSTWGAQGIYGEAAAYCDPRSAADIREKVARALDTRQNPEVAKSFLERYSWEAVTRKLICVYEEALRR